MSEVARIPMDDYWIKALVFVTSVLAMIVIFGGSLLFFYFRTAYVHFRSEMNAIIKMNSNPILSDQDKSRLISAALP